VERVRELIETALVGRTLDSAALGNYRYGRRLSALPGVAIVEICSYVLLPAFSRIAPDRSRFRSTFLKSISWIWLAAAPATGFLIAVGEPLVVTLLGPPWRDAGVVLVTASGFCLARAISAVASESIKASGRTRLLKWVMLVDIVSALGLLIALLPFGLVGIGLSISVSSMLSAGTALMLAIPIVGVRVADVGMRLAAPAISTFVAVMCVAPLEHFAIRSDERPVLVGISLLALDAAIFVCAYLLVIWLVARETAQEIMLAVRRTLRRATQAGRTQQGCLGGKEGEPSE
jgi:O-antigen/teichoic acid export membrane protein